MLRNREGTHRQESCLLLVTAALYSQKPNRSQRCNTDLGTALGGTATLHLFTESLYRGENNDTHAKKKL